MDNKEIIREAITDKAWGANYVSDGDIVGILRSMAVVRGQDIIDVADELDTMGYDRPALGYIEADNTYRLSDLCMVEAINPENEQRLTEWLGQKDEQLYETAKIELTRTSRYHDWSGTIADRILGAMNSEDGEIPHVEANSIIDLIQEYNQRVGEYNEYGDMDSLPTEGIITADMVGFK